MPITTQEISDDQRDRIVCVKEGHFLDLKDVRIQPSKLTRTISGLANADGGEIYIGISQSSPKHSWKGFPTVEAANGYLQVFEDLFPLGHDYVYAFLSHPSEVGLLLHVTVRKTRAIVKASDGFPYLRRGAQNLPVDTSDKRRRLELNKGIITFEVETVGAPVTSITQSETVRKFISEVIPTTEPEPWLQKQQLIQDAKPTVAGVLLFADLPQAILPKRSGIKIYRYKTGKQEGSRDSLVDTPISVEGCAYDLIRDAVFKTQEIISNVHVLSADSLEHVEYPSEALHEVITNAVIHRDYEIADDVHVRIFDNRVEVESPGRLAGHVTVKNILRESFRRNGNLVRILNKFPNPPNKDIGEGLRTAFEAMRTHRLKEPEIVETEQSVIVKIRHEKLASAEEIVLEHLVTHDTITNRKARELTGIQSENSMKNVFNRLKALGLIEMVPEQRGARSAWRSKGPVLGATVHARPEEQPSEKKQKTLFDGLDTV
ncbi:MAG: ATP-binding protein [Thermoguttaceae bacterium]